MFVAISWATQIIPFYGIFTFAPMLLAAFNIDGAIKADIIVSIMFMLCNVLAIWLCKLTGRRPLVITAFAVSVVALGLLGMMPNSGIVVVLLLFLLFAMTNGINGILQILYPNELFPTEIRASAVGFGTGASRIGSAISNYVMPTVLSLYGIGTLMLMGAGIAAIGSCCMYSMGSRDKKSDSYRGSNG